MATQQKKFVSLDNDRVTLKGRIFGSTGPSQFNNMGGTTKAAQIAQINLNTTFNMMR